MSDILNKILPNPRCKIEIKEPKKSAIDSLVSYLSVDKVDFTFNFY